MTGADRALNFAWRRLPTDPGERETVAAVAPAVVARYPRTTARYPIYRFDFPQSPSAAPPVAQLANSNPAWRDASLAGAQLARRRPVNVVRFTYGTAEMKRESAAAVFVFHGRYCIYVPEVGTVPFRVRGGVQNLQLIPASPPANVPGSDGPAEVVNEKGQVRGPALLVIRSRGFAGNRIVRPQRSLAKVACSSARSDAFFVRSFAFAINPASRAFFVARCLFS